MPLYGHVISELAKDPNISKVTERYSVYDFNHYGARISMTVLYPRRETLGHSHPYPQYYLFLEGVGYMRVGEKTLPVQDGIIVTIEPDEYHRVVNLEPSKCLVFIDFPVQREDIKYGGEPEG